MRVVTWNILAPGLVPEHELAERPVVYDKTRRLRKIEEMLQKEVEIDSIICLQEVPREWAAKLTAFFASVGYTFICSNYGGQYSGYVGVGIAYPTALYALADCHIVRVNDTKKGGWKPAKNSNNETKRVGGVYDMLFSSSIVNRLVDVTKSVFAFFPWLVNTLKKKFLQRTTFEEQLGTWGLVKKRHNTLVALELIQKDDKSPVKEAEGVLVVTYHNPCQYKDQQAMRIHTSLLLQAIDEISGGKTIPVILAGDLNIQPQSPAYKLITKGKLADGNDPESFEALYSGDPFEITPETLKPYRDAFSGLRVPFTCFSSYEKGVEALKLRLDYIFYRSSARTNLFPLYMTDMPARCREIENQLISSLPSMDYPSDHLIFGVSFASIHCAEGDEHLLEGIGEERSWQRMKEAMGAIVQHRKETNATDEPKPDDDVYFDTQDAVKHFNLA